MGTTNLTTFYFACGTTYVRVGAYNYKAGGREEDGFKIIATVIATTFVLGFPGSSDGKESACNSGHLGSIPD